MLDALALLIFVPKYRGEVDQVATWLSTIIQGERVKNLFFSMYGPDSDLTHERTYV